MSYDSQTLCGHVKALLSGSVPENLIKSWVGMVNNLNPTTRKMYLEEIGMIFTRAMAGIDPVLEEGNNPFCTYRHISMSRGPDGITWSHPLVDRIYHMDYASSVTQKIWAGMTNLKSCLFRLDSKLSRSEKDKVLKGILHKPTVDTEVLPGWRKFLREFLPKLIDKQSFEDEYHPLWAFSASEKRFVFVDEQGKVTTSPRTDEGLYDPTGYFLIPEISQLAKSDCGEFLTRTLYGSQVEAHWLQPLPEAIPSLPMGMVRLSPKNGMKPRIVVVMTPMIASLSYPLGKKLKRLNSRWNIQFVDDQDAAKEYLREQLRFAKVANRPETVRSFDQSAFTDYFPYDLVQRPVLEALSELGYISDFDIQVMDAICHGLYDMSCLRPKFFGYYGTGTCMGSYPSFPLGSLANGLIAAYAYYLTYGELPDVSQRKGLYALVVGDDVVILDKQIACHYESLCGSFGMIINRNKSIESTRMAEFCSTLITAEGIFPKKKLPAFVDFESLKTPIEYYGPDAFINAWPKFEAVTREILEIPKPFGLGPELDMDVKYPQSELLQGLKAQIQANVLDPLKGGSVPAIDAFVGFNRALFDTDGLVYKPYPNPFRKDSLMEPHENTVTDLPPFERSLLQDVDDCITIIEKAELSSDKIQEAADRIDEVYWYFLQKYPDRLRKSRTIFTLLQKRGKASKQSQIASLIDKHREEKRTPNLESDKGGRKGGHYHER